MASSQDNQFYSGYGGTTPKWTYLGTHEMALWQASCQDVHQTLAYMADGRPAFGQQSHASAQQRGSERQQLRQRGPAIGSRRLSLEQALAPPVRTAGAATFMLKRIPYGIVAEDLVALFKRMGCGRSFDLLFVMHGRGAGLRAANWTYAVINFPKMDCAEHFMRSLEAHTASHLNDGSPLKLCRLRPAETSGFEETLEHCRRSMSSTGACSLYCSL